MARIDLKQCTVQFLDGTTPTANVLNIKNGNGSITWTVKRNFIYVLNRGKLDTVRLGDQEPVEFKMDLIYEFLEMGSVQTPLVSPEDFLRKRANAAGYVTAGADPCQPYAVTIKFAQVQDCPGVPSEIVLLTEFRFEKISHDLRGGMLNLTGKCNIQVPTISRV